MRKLYFQVPQVMHSRCRRHQTVVASHSYGWYLRVVVTSVPLGTRQHCALVAYLKARFPRPVFFPAISQPLRGSCMAGYHYLMPTASVAQKRVEECTNRSTAISLLFNFRISWHAEVVLLYVSRNLTILHFFSNHLIDSSFWWRVSFSRLGITSFSRAEGAASRQEGMPIS